MIALLQITAADARLMFALASLTEHAPESARCAHLAGPTLDLAVRMQSALRESERSKPVEVEL